MAVYVACSSCRDGWRWMVYEKVCFGIGILSLFYQSFIFISSSSTLISESEESIASKGSLPNRTLLIHSSYLNLFSSVTSSSCCSTTLFFLFFATVVIVFSKRTSFVSSSFSSFSSSSIGTALSFPLSS